VLLATVMLQASSLRATRFFILVLHGAGLELVSTVNSTRKSNQIDNDTLCFATRSELLGNELSSWIPTASAVRHYTVVRLQI